MINALALSRIWYVASVVHRPSWVLRELNRSVFQFFIMVGRILLPVKSLPNHPRVVAFLSLMFS